LLDWRLAVTRRKKTVRKVGAVSESISSSIPNDAERFFVINRPYLVVLNMPYFVDAMGRTLFERTWHHDLIQHLHYLPNFTLAAPLHSLPTDTANLVPIGEGLQARMKLVALPSQTSRMRALAQLPKIFRTLWHAIGQAEIVHTSVAGWPYPLGWLTSPIALLRRKKLLIIVESAPWRPTSKPGTNVPMRSRVEASVYEFMARVWCSRADLSFYTQPAYLNQLHSHGKRPAYVTPAVWVNAEQILDDSQARSLWDAKVREPVRFLFAGRLVAEKGVRTLLEAVEKLTAAGVHGTLHVIGDGPLRDQIIAAERTAPFSLKYFKPLPYGPRFLNFLQAYHAVLIPSLSDEQPRIVFDAAARAVPVLASETDGLRPHVEDNRTGGLITPGDASALAQAMSSWAGNPELLRRFGLDALSLVRGKTHKAMHAERSQILARHLGAR
jgi:glycosyltransferase involved in cell wall biosynthesis